MRTILCAARAVDEDLLGKDSVLGVFRSNGTLEYATPAMRTWLNAGASEFLRRAVVDFDKTLNRTAIFTIGHAEVRLVRIDGASGVRYLTSVTHAILPRLSPLFRLSERQREVARLAAAGFTNREISDALDVSEHTVREHLSRAFRRLGVDGRLEFHSLLQASTAL